MKTSMSTLKEVIEQQVREAFEQDVKAAVDKIRTEAIAQVQSEIDKIKEKSKKMANQMTLEMMQKMNVNGITVEFKL